MPGLTFISFGNIAHNAYRGFADLTFERKIPGKSFSYSQEVNPARDFTGRSPASNYSKDLADPMVNQMTMVVKMPTKF
jgi:hypothetical protein